MKRPLITLAGLLLAAAASAQTNLALTGVATQSSTSFNGPAWKANDGNTSGDFVFDSLSHTDYQAQPWWQVALGADAAIGEVLVWNRTDCCTGRLSDYTVSLWNDGVMVGSQFFAGTSPATQSFSFDALVADTVRVQLSGTNYLSLAEVQVFAAPVPEPGTWALMAAGLVAVARLARRRG